MIHGYSTPVIKTIKSILFSHTIDDFTQIVRWKFVKTRLFLDIPTSEYPDFASFIKQTILSLSNLHIIKNLNCII